jgi:6-phosphogluconolactonase/glucosamine-6-phosphate isomerase/deaminase
LVYATCAPVTPHHRVTLGPTVLRAAKKAVLMISGREKRETLAAVMNGPPDPTRYSVQILWPILDRVTWFIDHAAAPRFLRDADGTA